MALDISGIYFFMPVFSFLFVFVIIYAILAKTRLLGDSQFANVLVGLMMSIIFMSFSSIDLYVRTIIPWFIVLFVMVFLILLITGLSNKDISKVIGSKFAWVVISILVVVFLIAAIKVFNPIFHPDLIITSGDGAGVVSQLREYLDSRWVGGILLVIVAIAVSYVLTKK